MEENNDLDFLTEWAVWGHLDSKADLELVLLKGHLLLETVLNTALRRRGHLEVENFSFFRKITTLETIDVTDKLKKEFIISALKDINKIRNTMAHEFLFNISNGEFETWALNVLTNLKGNKFTKYTHRTKLVHAFSALSKNTLELK